MLVGAHHKSRDCVMLLLHLPLIRTNINKKRSSNDPIYIVIPVAKPVLSPHKKNNNIKCSRLLVRTTNTTSHLPKGKKAEGVEGNR